MACGCKKNRSKFIVKLPGGLEVQKASETAAKSYAAKHPGSRVIKPGAE